MDPHSCVLFLVIPSFYLYIFNHIITDALQRTSVIITTINQLALNPMQQANNFHGVLNALIARLYFFAPKMLMKLHYIKGRERGKKGKVMWPQSWGSPDPGSPAWILPGVSTRKPKPGLPRRSACQEHLAKLGLGSSP